ncbi:MAG TPA: DUF4012 domain-containing protein [Sporichthyaceae bacterium]|nr:DUF4012 domain-containing protein [Sporichthyaceae bacterium]
MFSKFSRRARRAARQPATWGLVAAGGLGVGWLALTAVLARGHLEQAAADAAAMRTHLADGDLGAARAAAADLRLQVAKAHHWTGGPVWAAAARVPTAGDPLRSVRGIAAALDQLGANALPPLLNAGTTLDPASVRTPDGAIDVARLASVASPLHAASAAFDASAAAVRALPGSTWLPPVNAARADLLTQLTKTAATARSAAAAARILPELLGAHGSRTYLLTFCNDAEARGTGGLPGAFMTATVRDGHVSFEHLGADRALSGASANVNFGPDYDRLYEGAHTTSMYGNANLGPHFPYAAAIWASMWQQHFGRPVDGVIALDPTVLSYLLAATGPAKLPDGSVVSATNVVALTERDVYARFPDADGPRGDAARRAYLAAVEGAVSERIMAPGADGKKLLSAFGRAVGERRLLVWSANPAVQRDLETTPVAGVVPQTTAPYVGLSIVNEGGNKLDYYLDRSLIWQRTGCGAQRAVTVTIRLTNNAPAAGLSDVVTYRHDRHGYPVQRGDNRLTLSYFATRGALMKSVTLDGKPWFAGSGTQLGHPVLTVDVEMPRGHTRTVVLHLLEPAGGNAAPMVLRQPLVRPLAVQVDDAQCGR